MSRSLLVGVMIVLCAASSTAFADEAASRKEQLARQLMEVTGSAELGEQVLQAMTAQFRDQEGLPPGFLDKFLELAKPDELVEQIVPLYVQAYDEETLHAALEFYESPAGRKFKAGLPQITQEAFARGQAWGVDLAQQAFEAVAPPSEEAAP